MGCMLMKKRIVIYIILIIVSICSGFFIINDYNNLQSKYDSALVAIENNDYEMAIELLSELGNFKDSAVLHKETLNKYYYSQAKSKMSDKDYEQASELFLKVSGYEDADQLRMECNNLKLYQTYAQANVRDKIEFAGKNYIVLDKIDSKLLIRSYSSVATRAYEPSATISSWSTSKLREYLNSSFLTDNFSENERNMICSTKLTTNDVETTDKVFIFSLDEALEYRMITKLDSHNWWLRDIVDPYENLSTALYVNEHGDLVKSGMYTNLKAGLIIGMWIDFSKV